MRIHAIAAAAIYVVASAGCSGELAERAPANDPTSAAAAEAPFHPTPAYQPDPLLSPVPPKAEQPAGHDHGAVFVCPMHPEVKQSQPGKCPKCGMTLVPKDGAP